MEEQKSQLIGVRFTETEREIIEKIVSNKKNTNLTDFIREAVFSHIYNLKENVAFVKVNSSLNKLKNMEKNIASLSKIIKSLKKSLTLYENL